MIRLVEAAYAEGWIRPFDWPTWKETDEAKALLDDPSTATEEQLSKLLTALVRADRFSEGTLRWAIATGLAARMARRADELRNG